MSALTKRQTDAFVRIIRNVKEHFDIDVYDGIKGFTLWHEEESRPGRGHRVRFNYADGDYVLAGFMDVYGDYSLSVGTVDWLHQDCDCECSMCAAVTA